MIKFLEDEIMIYCRKEDESLVKELIPECEQEFKEIMQREVSSEQEYSTKVTLSEGDYLTPEQGGELGGIMLSTTNRRIVCPNTL